MNSNGWKSLQECLDDAKLLGNDEYWAIQHYIIHNRLEKQYIDLITALSQSRVSRLEDELSKHQWLACPADHLYEMVAKKKISPELARNLDLAQRYTMLGLPLDGVAEKLKGKVENMKTPNPFYVQTIIELAKLGVKFANDK